VTALVIFFAQLVAPAAAEPQPDIEIRARVHAERVEVRQESEARLDLRVEPGVAPPVQVERSAPAGQRTYRNLTIELKAAARIADPAAPTVTPAEGEQTGEPE
jgi:hypothetical protein